MREVVASGCSHEENATPADDAMATVTGAELMALSSVQ
jgi:hypothetical protein